MAYKITPKEAGIFTASDTFMDVNEEFESQYIYYAFVGNHVTYTDTSDDPVPLYDSEQTKRDAYNKMLFGKRIKPTDTNLVVPRYDYVPQKVYDAYDDTDTNIYGKAYFVAVKRGGEYDVFKCLDNYGGSLSTVPPDKTQITDFDEIYRTSDNYVWKYMYTITSAVMNKFATVDFIPVTPNTSVQGTAKNGSIDVIKVEYGGSRYDNYLYGSIGTSDIGIDGNPYKINVSGNNKSSTSNNFYNGCVFKVTSGTGVGSHANVASYTTSGLHRVVTLDTLLTLDLSSTYEITPGVEIVGDYSQTVNAIARAVINSVANSVDYIEILERGADYRQANATVIYNSVVPVSAQANVRPIMSPPGGHGADSVSELGGSRVCFSVTFDESSDNLPSINDFRQVGLMTNPRYAEVHVDFSSKDAGQFLSGETVYQVNPVQLFGSGVTVTASSNNVTATNGAFTSLEPNTLLYLVSSDSKQLARIHSVSDDTTMVLDTVGAFSCTDTQIYLANVSGPATVSYDTTLGVVLTDVYKPYGTGHRLVGLNSGISGVVSSLSVAGTSTALDTFNQMWKYDVSTGDTFTPDEVVTGDSVNVTNAHGKFFGMVGTSPKIMLVSDQVGIINNGETIRGATSNKTALVNDKFQPDLIYNSGKIVYLENLEKVARSVGQKETFKIVFEF